MSEQSSNVPVKEGRLESILPPRMASTANVQRSKMKFAPKAIPRKRREGTSLLEVNKNNLNLKETESPAGNSRSIPKPRAKPEPPPLTASGPLSMGPSSPFKSSRGFSGGRGSGHLYHPPAAAAREDDSPKEEEEGDPGEGDLGRLNLSNFSQFFEDPMAPVYTKRLEKRDQRCTSNFVEESSVKKIGLFVFDPLNSAVKDEPVDYEMSDSNNLNKSKKELASTIEEECYTVNQGMHQLDAEFGNWAVNDELGDKVFFFQLPSVLPVFDYENKERPHSWPPPDGIVGQLKVHRSGRTVLQLGDIDMEVSLGSDCSFFQELVVIDPNTDHKAWSLGSISKRIVVTPDISELLHWLLPPNLDPENEENSPLTVRKRSSVDIITCDPINSPPPTELSPLLGSSTRDMASAPLKLTSLDSISTCVSPIKCHKKSWNPKSWFPSDPQAKLHRQLESRHMLMLAVGGTIGTGIFLSAGVAVAIAGPGAALLSYILVGIFVYGVVVMLGEMSSLIPTSGGFATFGDRFVDPALGFALGINYYLQWSFSIPSELTAAAVVLQFWAPDVQSWVWPVVIIAPIFALQLINVRAYGEMEYWAALIKVVLICLFIIVGLLYDWGALHSIASMQAPGLDNFRHGQAFLGGLGAFLLTFVYAFYSYGGCELVALASGEAVNPSKTIPKAIKATFVRITLFFILTIFVIGLCINHADPSLLKSDSDSDVAKSPITVVFERAGFGAAKHVVNAVLLTAILSATNSCFYASSRMMLSLSQEGKLPRALGYVNSRGVPIPALFFTLGISFLTFLTTIWGKAVVFTWFLNVTGISALITWASVAWINIRFRRAFIYQGRSIDDLPYRQPLYPLLPIVTLFMAVIMLFGETYAALRPPFSWRKIFGTYLGLIVFIICYVAYKCIRKTSFIHYGDCDFESDATWGPGDGQRERDRKREHTLTESLKNHLRRRKAPFDET